MGVMRDLANQPANVCTPSYLARASQGAGAQGLHRSSTRARPERSTIAERLQDGFVPVRDARHPRAAALIVFEYYGAERRPGDPVVLVGKGVTSLDTGGISLEAACRDG